MMKLDLAHLDLEKVDLQLPSTDGEENRAQGVRIRSARGLSGTLTQDPQTLRIANTRADTVHLDATRLWFGTVLVETEGTSTLQRVSTDYTRDADGTTLGLELSTLQSDLLRIAVGTVTVSAEAALADPKLAVKPGAGTVDAQATELGRFALRLGDVAFSAPELRAETLRVGWGHGSFELHATGISAPAVEMTTEGVVAETGSVQAASLRLKDGVLRIDELRVGNASVNLDLVRAPVEPEAAIARTAASTGTPPLLDWAFLDGLSGSVQVDAVVELRIPVLHRRRATHELRVPIDQGTIDYRQLETNLARLEESLLDFSVRDDALVLELGLPLLPTRGRGKPLIRWPLSGSDLRLAHEDRVRLAVLPSVELPAKQNGTSASVPPSDPDSSRGSVWLKELGLRNIQADLVLQAQARPAQAVIQHLAWEGFRIGGFVEYRNEEENSNQAGLLKAQLHGLELTLRGLLAGEKLLDLIDTRVQRISECELNFSGLRPQRLRVELDTLAVQRIEHRDA